MGARSCMYGTYLPEVVQSGLGSTESCQANISELGGVTSLMTWVMGAHQAYTAATVDDPFLSWDDTGTAPNAGVVLSTGDYVPALVGDSSAAGSVSASLYAGAKTRVKCGHVLGLDLKTGEATNPDKKAESTGTSTTTSSSWQDKATLTFTPNTAGDYLLVCSALRKHGATTSSMQVQLDVDGSSQLNAVPFQPASTSQWSPWSCVAKVTLTAASHTIKIQYKSTDGTSTASIKQAFVIALRLDRFKNVYYSEHGSGRGRVGVSSNYSTYTTYFSYSPTIVNSGNHLIIMGLTFDNTAGKTGYCRFVQDPSGTGSGTTYQWDGYFVPNTSGIGSTIGDSRCPLVMMKQSLSSGSGGDNAFLFEGARTSAPGSTGLANGAICIIELDEVGGGRVLGLGQTADASREVFFG